MPKDLRAATDEEVEEAMGHEGLMSLKAMEARIEEAVMSGDQEELRDIAVLTTMLYRERMMLAGSIIAMTREPFLWVAARKMSEVMNFSGNRAAYQLGCRACGAVTRKAVPGPSDNGELVEWREAFAEMAHKDGCLWKSLSEYAEAVVEAAGMEEVDE